MSAHEDYIGALIEDIEIGELPPLLQSVEDIKTNSVHLEVVGAETEPTEQRLTSWAIYSAMVDAS